MAKKKNTTKSLLITLVVLIVVLGILGGFAKYKGWIGGGDEGVEVETAKAKLKTITQIVSASGKIQPEIEVIIRPDVSGEIIQLNVKEGDYVKQGDLLLLIKPDIYQARIDELNASLLTQKSRLEQARATMINAESNYKKQKELYEKKVISETAYIQAKTDYEAANANFKAAQYQIQSAEAQLRRAKEELQQTVIRAPMDGTVSKLNVEKGERVLGNAQVAGTELMRVARMNQMEVQVEVNENDIVNVAVNDTANIEVDSYPEKVFKGIVTEIANSAEIIGTGTQEQVTNYEVKVRVTTPHNLDMAGSDEMIAKQSGEKPEKSFFPSFKPGMSATVDIETETVNNVVSIPIQAVTVRDFTKDSDSNQKVGDRGSDDNKEAKADTAKQTDDELFIPKEDLRKVVFKVVDGNAKRLEVKTGISDNTHIQVLAGVSIGDEIIIGPYRVLSKSLKDGDKVKVNNKKFNQMLATQ